MDGDWFTLSNPVLRDLGNTAERTIQEKGSVRLPQGHTVVSADTHWEICDDIFFERFPKHLKDLAPRVWFDRYWRIGYPGQVQAVPETEIVARVLEAGNTAGLWDKEIRLRELAAEGVEKEIVFPQTLIGFARYPNLEVQEWMYRVFNEYAAERCASIPGRFFGVGVVNNWWDPARAVQAVRQIVDLGLKSFLVPISPGKYLDGRAISFADPEMDALWSAAEDSGLPVNFHIGENPNFDGPGGFGANQMHSLSPFRKALGQLIFGRVFDRHPKLRIVFTEAGISWVAPALQDAELIFDVYSDLLHPRPSRRPSEYWHENCYATFQIDKLGLEQLKYIGADRVMWGSDYPHSEGTYGRTWAAMQAVMDNTTESEARLILGNTASKVYKL